MATNVWLNSEAPNKNIMLSEFHTNTYQQEVTKPSAAARSGGYVCCLKNFALIIVRERSIGRIIMEVQEGTKRRPVSTRMRSRPSAGARTVFSYIADLFWIAREVQLQRDKNFMVL
jgi:hypothetical protein